MVLFSLLMSGYYFANLGMGWIMCIACQCYNVPFARATGFPLFHSKPIKLDPFNSIHSSLASTPACPPACYALHHHAPCPLPNAPQPGREDDSRALVALLSPHGKLLGAMFNADADQLIKFIFPLERLPVHTQVGPGWRGCGWHEGGVDLGGMSGH